jgi:hypothetical protein
MDRKKEPDSPPAEEMTKTTLYDFIDTNHKLISSLGVFIALTLFSMSLRLSYLGNLLTILLLLLTILIWFELVWRLPWGDVSITLGLFKYGIRFIFPLLLVYHLLEFRDFWHEWLNLPIWTLLLAGVSGLLSKIGFIKWVHAGATTWKHNLRTLLGIVIFFVLLYPITKLSSYLASEINAKLDKTYTHLLEKSIEEQK